jgi:hypothetical protein
MVIRGSSAVSRRPISGKGEGTSDVVTLSVRGDSWVTVHFGWRAPAVTVDQIARGLGVFVVGFIGEFGDAAEWLDGSWAAADVRTAGDSVVGF